MFFYYAPRTDYRRSVLPIQFPSSLLGRSEMVPHRTSLSLTGLGVHVSMNPYEFSILRRGHL